MSVYEVLPRFIVGGAMIASIPWFSQRFSPGVAGIVAVLPIVTLTSFISLALAQGTASVHSAIPKSFWGTFALYPYLGVMWFLLARGANIWLTLSIGTLAWAAAAAVVFTFVHT